MKGTFLTLVASAVIFLGACSDDVVTDPCDPDFVGPPEEGQCDD